MLFNVTNSGTALNFKVVGGTTQPTSPKENTIWVNTSVAIPSWAFSATEPGSPVAGMVWISTGTSSTVAFNALQKNTITVCPLAAKQYVSGQWVSVEAKTYQGREWHSWTRYLYITGDECNENGGAWVAVGKNISSDGGGSNKPMLSLGASAMTMEQTTAVRGGIVYKEQVIDLTSVTTINIKGTKLESTSHNNWTSLNVWSILGTYFNQNRAAYIEFGTTSGAFDLNLDVSDLIGEYYFGFGLYSTQRLDIQEVTLK